MNNKNLIAIILALFFSLSGFSQINSDSLKVKKFVPEFKLTLKNTAIPIALITYGVVGLHNPILKDWNLDVRSEVLEHIDRVYHADDYFQYSPHLAVYLLDDAGIKAKHNFKDRTTALITSYVIMTATVRILKNVTHVQRPDSSSFTSFPSGHTAMAFSGAEFLWQEYKDKSIWYGVAAYTMASAIGIARVINNKHWINDVAAGAGIGILSTKIAFIVNERIHYRLNNRKQVNALITPYYSQSYWGVGLAFRF